jgi:hypothetical protein
MTQDARAYPSRIHRPDIALEHRVDEAYMVLAEDEHGKLVYEVRLYNRGKGYRVAETIQPGDPRARLFHATAAFRLLAFKAGAPPYDGKTLGKEAERERERERKHVYQSNKDPDEVAADKESARLVMRVRGEATASAAVQAAINDARATLKLYRGASSPLGVIRAARVKQRVGAVELMMGLQTMKGA